MIVTSCSPGPAPSSTAPTDSAAPTEAASPEPTAPPTSEDLIESALAAGKITYEQSLLDRALALFNSPDMPADYRSAIPNLDAGTELFREVDSKAGTLSPGLLKQLAPYRARPSDPTSIFNTLPPATGLTGAVGVAAALAADPVPSVLPGWKSELAAGGKARVWVKDSANAAAQLASHVADVSTVWAAYPGIFTYPHPDEPGTPSLAANPDSAIDIYFVSVGALDPRRPECAADPSLDQCKYSAADAGYAQRAPKQSGHTSSGYVVLKEKPSSDDLLDTIAHELAHASQFAYDTEETSWLYESTATWVGYKVLKKLGKTPTFEYRRVPTFFSSADQPLTRTDKGYAYAAWLFFLYASTEAGNGVVTDIWTAAGADGVQGEQAVDKVFPFDKYFGQFSVRDWNIDPVQPQYKAADTTFPAGQPKVRNKTTVLAAGKDDSLDVSLPPLSSAYFRYSFPNSVRAVTFEDSLAGVPNAKVWGITNIGNTWKKQEDWTGGATRQFCRDVPEQDLVQVVIVVSNASPTDKLTVADPPKVTASAKGCSGWVGTMKGSWAYDLEGSHGMGTSSWSGMWVAAPPGIDPCTHPADDCTLYRPTGTVSWTWDSHHPGAGVTPPCDSTVSGTNAAGIDKAGDQQVFYTGVLDETHLHYWGAGQSFITDWSIFHCISNNNTDVGPPSYFGLDQYSSSTNPSGTGGDTCYIGDWTIENNGDTIAGSCYAYKNDRQWLKYEWSLKRVGPAQGG
jgi:hypothetical protein